MSYNNSNRNNGGYYNSRYNPSKKYNNSNGMNGQGDGGYGGGSYSGNPNSRRNDYGGGYGSNRYNKYSGSGSSSYSSNESYYSNGSGSSSGYRRKNMDRYDSYSARSARSASPTVESSSNNMQNSRQSSTYGDDRRQDRDHKYENRSYIDDRRTDNKGSYGRNHRSLTPEQYSSYGYTSDRRARSDEPRFDYRKSYSKPSERPARENESSYPSVNTHGERNEMHSEDHTNNNKSTPPNYSATDMSKSSSEKPNEILSETTKTSTDKEAKAEMPSDSKDTMSNQNIDVTSNSNHLNHTVEKESQEGKQDSDDEVKSTTESKDDLIHKSPVTSSHNIADSSMLSPVADSEHLDDAFFKNLDTINESNEDTSMKGKDNIKTEGDGNISEAETIITNSPPRINKGRRLIRKKDFDEERRKLKRRAIVSSEEEEEEEEEDYDEEEDSGEDDSGEDDHQKSAQSERKKVNERPYKLKRDSSGRSLLQRACKKGNFKDIENYLNRGAEANESDFCGFTCLHEAALEGHVDVVKMLLENDANINAQADAAGYFETPLMDAAENKHVETVKLLVSKGANPHVYNIDGFTALTKIYNEHKDEEGYDEIIEILEEAGNNYAILAPDKKAEEKGSVKVVSAAPKEVVEDPNNSYFSELIRKKNIYKFAAEGAKELTANYFVSGNSLESKPDILILAARNGHTELVDIILGLSSGPHNIDIENEHGLTPLLASVGRGHYEVVESLLVKGADPFKVRKNDQLTCLQISQKSVYYDPKEAKLIQTYMDKKKEKPQIKSELSAENKEGDSANSNNIGESEAEEDAEDEDEDRDDGVDEDESEEDEEDEVEDVSFGGKRKYSEESEDKNIKRQKPESKAKIIASRVFGKEKTPDLNESKTKDESLSPTSAKPKARSESSQSPTPLTKAQEELKAKNAEEARIWQQKVEAKKRARRDMFLKSEKEKERKRIQEEEKKLQEEKKLAILQEERALKLAEVEQQKTQQLYEERKALQKKMILESYPVGLQYVKFGELTKNEMLKYAPLYLFDINNEAYVIDLQFAFISGLSVAGINEKVTSTSRIELGVTDKSKVWPLFFPMIGIDPRKPDLILTKAIHEGHEKFQNLYLNFVKFDGVSAYAEKELPTTFNTFFEKGNVVNVTYDSLVPYDPKSKNVNDDMNLLSDDSKVLIDSKEIEKLSFVPPNLKRRKDTIKTIYSAHTPLW